MNGSCLPQAVEACFALCSSPQLERHFREHCGYTVPRSSYTILNARILMDLASMVHCRRGLLSCANLQRGQAIHLRCDASPQFGRDYLLTSADIVFKHCEDQLSNPTWLSMKEAKGIIFRMMPTQCLGLKASSLPYKLRRLVHLLSLETESLEELRKSLYSIVSDQGTESGFYISPYVPPAISQQTVHVDALVNVHIATQQAVADLKATELEHFLPFALPIADYDHQTHHVMSTLHEYWDWATFIKPTVRAITLYFRHKDRLNRFISTCVLRNKHMPEHLKTTFSKLFQSPCPGYEEGRWHYVHDC